MPYLPVDLQELYDVLIELLTGLADGDTVGDAV